VTDLKYGTVQVGHIVVFAKKVHASNIDRILDAKSGTHGHTILVGHVELSGIDLKPFRRLR
jgi:hypothetical protein